ncbi:hypothetical protein ASPZODRAFT_66568, partial [Penicilliopsis zonata CBS 506.65]
LGQEIETWVQALAYYDNQEYEEAISIFSNIAETSKIFFNLGVISATLGEHEKAVECYQRAIRLDQYLAIAYFQQGVSNFLLGDFEEALINFNDTLLYLRGNTSIDYEQLGLKFRLFSCEVLFNRGLCYIYLCQMGPGIQDLEYAVKEKVTPDHNVIDDAIRENAEGYTVFSIPVGIVYRPNAAKVKNLKAKDYLGKARVVASADRLNNNITDYKLPLTGMAHAPDDRLPENISYAATHLVHKDLAGRSRQQSEPPLNRIAFPPTPPPEGEKANGGNEAAFDNATGSSTLPPAGRSSRPPRLDLEKSSLHVSGRPGGSESLAIDRQQRENPRIGTTRTASEPRGPSARQHSRTHSGQQRGLARWEPSENPLREDEHIQGDIQIRIGDSRSMADPGRGGTSFPRHHRQPLPEDDEDSGSCDEEAENDGGFEIMGERRRRTQSPVRESRRANSRRPEVRKFRIKVHALEDTRYVMIGPTVEFAEFEGKIREKFGLRSRLRIKMQDDGDMITMGDQDDLDLLVSSAKQLARKDGSDMGKMETASSIAADTKFLQSFSIIIAMTDLTPSLQHLLGEKNGSQGVSRGTTETADEFLKEAYRISIRHAYLSAAPPRRRLSLSKSHQQQQQQQQLSDADRDSIDSSTALLLRDLSSSIANLASAESLRVETQTRLLDKKYGHTHSLLWRWAGGESAFSGPGHHEGDSDAGKPAEQLQDEESARALRTVRENILWFLRRGLESAVEAQRGMVEKRIERAKEKERSILYKTQIRTQPQQQQQQQPLPLPLPPPEVHEQEREIEAQLSREQLQLFAEENDLMLRHYEDTLSRVQNAEKSLLEISSLQETLVSHLTTQEEQIGQLVADASTTQTNLGHGNRELKRAAERRSTAQLVFWGTLGLCSWLVVWDLIF